MELRREIGYYRAMLRRLWLLVSSVWCLLCVSLIACDGGSSDALGPYVMAVAPFMLGYLGLLAVRYIWHGSTRPVWQRRYF